MLTLADVAAQHTDLSAADVDFLKLLVEQWDLVADLSFGDLILWLPDADPHVFWAAAQVRPTTGPTALHDDVVGESLSYETDSLVTEAFLTGEESTTSGNKLHAGIPVDCRAVPILRQGRVVGVVEVHTNQMGVRAPGALEENYLQCAAALRAMIQHGEFPMAGEKPVPSISPRVVDGLVRVDASGNVVFASPNATSAFRRLGVTGDVVGETFKSLLASVPPESRGPIERAITLSRDSVREFDLETKKASLRLRVQPLVAAGSLSGYLLTCRDTTELRTQERQLVSKDATIREIHHRVKNNLQTVSALLRLQARRTGSIEAKDALNDAQKRVGAIAVVHEILSQAYDDTVRFDDVADRLMVLVREVAAGSHVTMRREGSFGSVPAPAATSLSLVLTEVMQNAIEHGVQAGAGHVIVRARQDRDRLIVEVANDGNPIPDGFSVGSGDSLGLSIVAALVAELDGRFDIRAQADGNGSIASIEFPLG